MVNLQTQLFGNICHRTQKIIQKNLINFKLSRQTNAEFSFLKKITKFKFLVLFYKRSGYYFYILNIRDAHER